MPFIKKEQRVLVDKDVRMAEVPGDITYILYTAMLAKWREERRWTTAHKIYKACVLDLWWAQELLKDTKFNKTDVVAALHLAWQVFFIKEVMPYELEKEAENGSL